MAARGFPKKKNIEEFEKLDIDNSVGEGSFEGGAQDGLKPKLEAVSKRSLSVLKLLIGLCLLTFVYSSTKAFIEQFSLIEPKFQRPFWDGIIAFIVVYFFVWEPSKIYQKGQKLLEIVFKFFAPLVKVAPFVLPIYTVLLFCLYPLVYMFAPYEQTLGYFVFLWGFSIALHLVFGARSLRTKQGDFLKANYLFGFTFVYIFDILLIGLCLNLVFEKFSVVDFFNAAYNGAHEIILNVIRQVFVL